MESVTYQVRLAECGHDREFSQSIARTPSGKKKLQEEQARAEKAKQRLLDAADDVPEPVDADEQEAIEIRSEMNEPTIEETDDSGDPRELGIEQQAEQSEET
jgi:hypothetical protein